MTGYLIKKLGGIKITSLKINTFLINLFLNAKINLVDIKLEFGKINE